MVVSPGTVGALVTVAAGFWLIVLVGLPLYVFPPVDDVSPSDAVYVLGPPMPATVVRIAVKPGDAVRAGDVLIALEAMKMELPIRAPRDGIVAAVHCQEGELVQPGVSLVEIK